MARRYRIHFGANFDHEVEAADQAHAKLIAAELATMPTIASVSARNLRCAWITITPLGGDDPDAV
jgi:hypothetical protein